FATPLNGGNLRTGVDSPSPYLPISPSPPSGCATCYNGGNLRNAVAYHLPISPFGLRHLLQRREPPQRSGLPSPHLN
ncbi:MAG: hypothetical protein AAF915_08735, partial [Cyanobacteria bacterium P01_D01_bin.50]